MSRKHKSNAGTHFDMQFLTSCISTTLMLLLFGLMLFFVLGAHRLSVHVRENLSFSLLVDDNTKERDILNLQKQLNREPFVKRTAYISKEQALKEETEAMGTDPSEFLDYNPYSASIEVWLKAEYANADSIARIEQRIKQNSGIQDIIYEKGLVDAVNNNIRRISALLLGLAGILAIISFALINNTIRLTIYSKRFTIYTMKLVGASWRFIRKPFLRRNFWMGVVSACLANGMLWGAAAWLIPYDRQVVPILILVSMAVLVFGVLMTWLCALFSINKYLRMKADTLYHI